VYLARYHFFDGLTFHRVVPGRIIQTGDPRGDGTGYPGYMIPDEPPSSTSYHIGSVAMARSELPNSGGSQFFVISGAGGTNLPPEYAEFAHVVSGMEAVAAIDATGQASPRVVAERVAVESITVHSSRL
jgi:cyclophilin family peptidyl-prolyl cis-trans isomerase